MKKLLLYVASKMQPGIIQNIIERLGSPTPRMFVVAQWWSAAGSAACAATIEALQSHTIPDFRYEWLVIKALQFLGAVGIAFVAAFGTHTTSQQLHDESNTIATHPPLGPQLPDDYLDKPAA